MNFLTFFLVALQCSSLANRALLIGIDGFLTSCIKSAPNIDWMKANGSFTFKARSTLQAVSAPGWSSILCGQEPPDTGVLGNEWIPFWKSGKKNKITPFSGDGKFLCAFEAAKKHNKGLVTHMYHNWDWLRYIGPDIGFVDRYEEYAECTLATDQKITQHTIEAIKSKSFGLMFTYLGSLDETGHEKGFCDAEYIEHITKIDALVGQIINALKETNQLDSTIIVLTTDHGADAHTKSHGSENDSNLLVPFIVMGPGVKKGYEIKSAVHIADASPTLLSGLGAEIDGAWRGRPVKEAFTHIKSTESQ